MALTVWFLDDGGKSTGVRGGVFYILDNYTQYEIELFQHTFWARFHVKGYIHKSGRSRSGRVQKRLSITGKDYSTFYNILQPVLNCIPLPVLMSMKKFPKV